MKDMEKQVYNFIGSETSNITNHAVAAFIAKVNDISTNAHCLPPNLTKDQKAQISRNILLSSMVSTIKSIVGTVCDDPFLRSPKSNLLLAEFGLAMIVSEQKCSKKYEVTKDGQPGKFIVE